MYFVVRISSLNEEIRSQRLQVYCNNVFKLRLQLEWEKQNKGSHVENLKPKSNMSFCLEVHVEVIMLQKQQQSREIPVNTLLKQY